MNFYNHHIGDYLTATAHLTLIEHGAYRRLLDIYYSTEKPLVSDKKQLYRLVLARAKEEQAAVDVVLDEFFTETESGWLHDRCEKEIALCNKNRANGVKGGRPAKNKKPNETQAESEDKPKENPEITQTKPKNNPNETQAESPHYPLPITHTQYSVESDVVAQPPVVSANERQAKKGQTFIADDFEPSAANTHEAQKLGLDLQTELAKFKAHHTSKGTASYDWSAELHKWLLNAHGFAADRQREIQQRTSAGQTKADKNAAFLHELTGGIHGNQTTGGLSHERTIDSTATHIA